MAIVEPKLAPVKPRATRGNQRESRPLEDLLVELAEDMSQGVVLLEGGAGSGRSTALAHLAAALAHDERFVFFDDSWPHELARPQRIIVAALNAAAGATEGPRLKLAPWGADELMEYLLVVRPEACGSVLARLGEVTRRQWSPRLAVVILDRFLEDDAACDVASVLRDYVRGTTAGAEAWRHACRLCLTLSSGVGHKEVLRQLEGDSRYESVRKLVIPHVELWPILATEALLESLRSNEWNMLEGQLDQELVQRAGAALRVDAPLRDMLHQILTNETQWRRHGMAASLCFAADPKWRPKPRRRRLLAGHGCWLAGGYFTAAAWNKIDLRSGNLWHADLSSARLDEADFTASNANGTNFAGASLVGAELVQIEARDANFDGAILRDALMNRACCPDSSFVDADLTGAIIHDGLLLNGDFSGACLFRAQLTVASLAEAKFEDADLREANLRMAKLAGCDLRSARLDGARFDDAQLQRVILEDVHWPDAHLKGAVLRDAHLTGSRMPRADMRGAVFAGAGLAEIAWENADLRGADLRNATFHMGSSRSGLVGSPIACEGSKTGFYTDDFEDMHFKRPEDIRKANLCGADLRGANIEGLDFYLVDLRDAKLDRLQLDHVRRCGAILGRVLT